MVFLQVMEKAHASMRCEPLGKNFLQFFPSSHSECCSARRLVDGLRISAQKESVCRFPTHHRRTQQYISHQVLEEHTRQNQQGSHLKKLPKHWENGQNGAKTLFVTVNNCSTLIGWRSKSCQIKFMVWFSLTGLKMSLDTTLEDPTEEKSDFLMNRTDTNPSSTSAR